MENVDEMQEETIPSYKKDIKNMLSAKDSENAKFGSTTGKNNYPINYIIQTDSKDNTIFDNELELTSKLHI